MAAKKQTENLELRNSGEGRQALVFFPEFQIAFLFF